MKIREITEYISKYIHPDIDKQLQKYTKKYTLQKYNDDKSSFKKCTF